MFLRARARVPVFEVRPSIHKVRQFCSTSRRLADSPSNTEPHEDISEHLKSVSKLSGSGPFPCSPEFQLLGSPFTSALHVSLPSSAALYLKNGATVIGVTGDITRPKTSLEYSIADQPEGTKPDSLPLVYQRLTASNSLTMLLSAPAIQNKASWYALVTPTKSYDWLIKRDAVLAWGGSQLSLRPVSDTFHKLLSVFRTSGRGSPILVSGEGGQLALSNDSIIYEFKLTSNEQVFLRPGSIIGLTLPVTRSEILDVQMTPTRVPHLPLPTLTSLLPSSLQSMSGLLRSVTSNVNWPSSVKSTVQVVGNYVGRANAAFRTLVSQYLWQDDEFVKIQGPATVLLDHKPPTLVIDKIKSLRSK